MFSLHTWRLFTMPTATVLYQALYYDQRAARHWQLACEYSNAGSPMEFVFNEAVEAITDDTAQAALYWQMVADYAV